MSICGFVFGSSFSHGRLPVSSSPDSASDSDSSESETAKEWLFVLFFLLSESLVEIGLHDVLILPLLYHHYTTIPLLYHYYTTIIPLLYHYTTTSLYKSPQLRQDFMSSSFYNSPQSLAFLFQLSFSFFLFVDLKWRKFNKLCKYRIHCDLRVPLGKEVFQFLLLFSKQPRLRKVLTHNWRKVKVEQKSVN